MIKNKAYKFRIYPNQEQKILFAKTFGCSRFIYNQMLNERQDIYSKFKDDKEKLRQYQYRTEKDYKQEFNWLTEVDSITLQQSRLNLMSAYKNFFRRVKQKQNPGFPKFKSRHNRQSYRTVSIKNNIKVDFNNKKIKLPKVGWINYKDNRIFNSQIRSITVSKTKAGSYYVSILVQEEIQLKKKLNNVVGIDLGVNNFVTTSTGEKIESPMYFQKSESKLKRGRKKLSHKIKGSQNKNRQRVKLSKLYEKVRNQKTDFLQKLSSKIIDENQVIVLEDLNIQSMMKDKYRAKNIQQSNWYQFVQMLKYKADWYGRDLKQVGKYFPSTQLCNNCGYKNENLTLKDRSWVCPTCLMEHDRDINAAINLANTVGTTGINACGDMKAARAVSAQESTSFRAW